MSDPRLMNEEMLKEVAPEAQLEVKRSPAQEIVDGIDRGKVNEALTKNFTQMGGPATWDINGVASLQKLGLISSASTWLTKEAVEPTLAQFKHMSEQPFGQAIVGGQHVPTELHGASSDVRILEIAASLHEVNKPLFDELAAQGMWTDRTWERAGKYLAFLLDKDRMPEQMLGKLLSAAQLKKLDASKFDQFVQLDPQKVEEFSTHLESGFYGSPGDPDEAIQEDPALRQLAARGALETLGLAKPSDDRQRMKNESDWITLQRYVKPRLVSLDLQDNGDYNQFQHTMILLAEAKA